MNNTITLGKIAQKLDETKTPWTDVVTIQIDPDSYMEIMPNASMMAAFGGRNIRDTFISKYGEFRVEKGYDLAPGEMCIAITPTTKETK